MRKINIGLQRRIIHDPKDNENTKVPQMPLLIGLNNGIMGEAKTIRGATAIVIGSEYLDTEDGIDDWHLRVEEARRAAMRAIARGLNVVVYDSRKGIIENNYAAAPGDPDYGEDPEEPIRMPVKIRVENDRLFILSLLQIEEIKVYEREDSYLMRPHPDWDMIKLSGGALQNCSRCLHKIEDPKEGIICPVYDEVKRQSDGGCCGSYTIQLNKFVEEYIGGTYIDLSAEYDINELMRKVGQGWIVKG